MKNVQAVLVIENAKNIQYDSAWSHKSSAHTALLTMIARHILCITDFAMMIFGSCEICICLWIC